MQVGDRSGVSGSSSEGSSSEGKSWGRMILSFFVAISKYTTFCYSCAVVHVWYQVKKNGHFSVCFPQGKHTECFTYFISEIQYVTLSIVWNSQGIDFTVIAISSKLAKALFFIKLWANRCSDWKDVLSELVHTIGVYLQWAPKALQCLAVLDCLWCSTLQHRNHT